MSRYFTLITGLVDIVAPIAAAFGALHFLDERYGLHSELDWT